MPASKLWDSTNTASGLAARCSVRTPAWKVLVTKTHPRKKPFVWMWHRVLRISVNIIRKRVRSSLITISLQRKFYQKRDRKTNRCTAIRGGSSGQAPAKTISRSQDWRTRVFTCTNRNRVLILPRSHLRAWWQWIKSQGKMILALTWLSHTRVTRRAASWSTMSLAALSKSQFLTSRVPWTRSPRHSTDLIRCLLVTLTRAYSWLIGRRPLISKDRTCCLTLSMANLLICTNANFRKSSTRIRSYRDTISARLFARAWSTGWSRY
jgi:hypothetical protein